MHRIIILLRRLGLPLNILGPYTLCYTFTVLPSTQQLQTEVTPPIPTRIQQLLLPHAISEAALMPKSLHSPFGHTLAHGLGLNSPCIALRSALSAHKCLQVVYHLSGPQRQHLLNSFSKDFQHCCTSALVKKNISAMKSLKDQYEIARLVTNIYAPICDLPPELLDHILTISIKELGISPNILQEVCQKWKVHVSRLWGTLKVGTWTESAKISEVLDHSPLSLDVVIDTTMDEAYSITADEPYAALDLAWKSSTRWRSLTIDSFPSNASTLASKVPVYHGIAFDNLEFLEVGQGCNSFDRANEIMKVIASTANQNLTSLKFASGTVFGKLNQPGWSGIYSQLTALEVDIVKSGEPVELLCHCERLERLKLSGVVLQDHSPRDPLHLLQTLRHLWLQRVSIRWMGGRIFERLESCELLKPVDPHYINETSVVSLPLCSSITLQSRALSILRAFHAGKANKIVIECNERNGRSDCQLGRVWSRRWDNGTLRPKVLSLGINCRDRALLEALQLMSSLEELVLELRCPSALGASFFEALCGMPMNHFTGGTREEWNRWANYEAKWKARICPSLVKLQLRYERWLRKGEMDAVTPLLVAVAWTRGKLYSPLQEFDLRPGNGKPLLQLVQMTDQDPTFMALWAHMQVIPESGTQKDMLYMASLTTAISRSIGFVNGEPALPFDCLGDQCYDSFFRRLRAFHHHPSQLSPRSYDILPFFEHLEELDVCNFHFTPCSPAASLSVCQTLRILHIRNSPLDWMDGRSFERVVGCRIAVCNDGHIGNLSRIEMPACTKMEFSGPKSRNVLEFFYPPNHDSHLQLSKKEGMYDDPKQAQAIVLTIRSIRVKMLPIRLKLKDKNAVTAMQSSIDMAAVSEHGNTNHFESKTTDKKAKGPLWWLAKLFGTSRVHK